MRLLSDVRFSLMPARNGIDGKVNPRAGAKEPIHVTGKRLDFERESRTMQLQGPVEAWTHAARLRAGRLTLTMDAAFRAEKLAAAGANGKNPDQESQAPVGPPHLTTH